MGGLVAEQTQVGRPGRETCATPNLCYVRRRRAAERAWRDSELFDAAERPSRFRARVVARERFADVLCFAPDRPVLTSRSACLRVRAEVVPFLGGANLTPARRALDRPMAMACLVERAPCLPSRMCSISSRTNSPA